MQDINKKQTQYLKSLAHKLKPVVMIGQHGLTEAVLVELETAIEHHELIKVKVSGADRDTKAAIIHTISEHLGCHVVQTVGHIATLYRPKKDAKKAHIKLP